MVEIGEIISGRTWLTVVKIGVVAGRTLGVDDLFP